MTYSVRRKITLCLIPTATYPRFLLQIRTLSKNETNSMGPERWVVIFYLALFLPDMINLMMNNLKASL